MRKSPWRLLEARAGSPFAEADRRLATRTTAAGVGAELPVGRGCPPSGGVQVHPRLLVVSKSGRVGSGR